MLLLLLLLLHNERGAADVAAAALAAIRAPQPQTAARPNREILHIDSETIHDMDAKILHDSMFFVSNYGKVNTELIHVCEIIKLIIVTCTMYPES